MVNKMKKINVLFLMSITYLFGFTSNSVLASAEKICNVIKKEKLPTAYLVDKNGSLSNGPIQLGDFAVSRNLVADQIIAPTQYNLIISPKKLKLISNCPAGGCIKLKKIKDICPNSKTYSIGIGFSFTHGDGVRPYKIEAPNKFIGLDFEDPSSDYPITLNLKFDQSVVGKLIEPTTAK